MITTTTRRCWTDVVEQLWPPSEGDCPRHWELNVAGYLFELGYTAETIGQVLQHCNTNGTVECLRIPGLAEADRAEVERRLPDAPAGVWARWGDTVWMDGPTPGGLL